MAKQFEFTNSSKWDLFWSESFTAEPVNVALRRYYPIGRVGPSIQLSQPTIAIWCGSDTAQENWRYGARYFIKMFTGLTVNGGVPETVIKVGKIYLNQIKIVQIPEWASSFSIEIDIPFWHEQFSVIAWEYTGSKINTIEDNLERVVIATNA